MPPRKKPTEVEPLPPLPDDDFGEEEEEEEDEPAPDPALTMPWPTQAPPPRPVMVEQPPVFQAEQIPLQPASIPLWEGTRGADPTYRLRIERVAADGERQSLGYLPHDAGEEALLYQFRSPGTYWIMPVDEQGRSRRADPIKRVIPPDHPVLVRMRAETPGTTPASPLLPGLGGALIPKEVLDFLENTRKLERAFIDEKLDALEAERKHMEAERAALRKEVSDARESLAKEKLALAANQSNSLIELQDKIVSAAQARETSQQSQVFTTLAKMQEEAEARHRRAMEELKAANEQRQRESEQEHERRMKLMEMQIKADQERIERERHERNEREKEERRLREERLEREEKERARREKEEREDRERRIKEMTAEAERRRAQDQQFFKELSAIRTENANPLNQLGTALKQFDGIRGMLGLPGVGEKVESEGGESLPSNLTQLIGFGLGRFFDMQKDMIKLQIDAAMGGVGPKDEEDEVEEADPAQIPGGQTPQIVDQGGVPPASATPEQQLQATVADRAKDVPPDVQKRARKAVRFLIGQLRSTPESDWLMKVVAPIWEAEKDVLGPYLLKVGLRTAAKEGGADDELASKIASILENTGLLPPNVPRN